MSSNEKSHHMHEHSLIMVFPGALDMDGLCKRFSSWVCWEVSICLQTSRELRVSEPGRDSVEMAASVIRFFSI